MRPFSRICRGKARLVGKTVLITGGNSGIGKEIVRDLYRRGARVIIACPFLAEANAAVEEIKTVPPSKPDREQFNGDPGELVVYYLDLTSFSNIREFAKTLIKTEENIHILINNAGVGGCPYQKTEDGFEMVLQINYLGHFLLTLLLLPKLRSSAPGVRIINVSSVLHFFGNIHFDNMNLEGSYTRLKAYGQSKLAMTLFTKELARRLKEAGIEGISVYALHPGIVRTRIYQHFDNVFFRVLATITMPFTKSPELGAQTTLHCAVDEEAGKQTGKYYKECATTFPSPRALNKRLAVRLWNESVKLVGLTPEDNLAAMLSTISNAS